MLRSYDSNTAAHPAPEDRDDGDFHGVTNNAMLCGAAVEPNADRPMVPAGHSVGSAQAGRLREGGGHGLELVRLGVLQQASTNNTSPCVW